MPTLVGVERYSANPITISQCKVDMYSKGGDRYFVCRTYMEKSLKFVERKMVRKTS